MNPEYLSFMRSCNTSETLFLATNFVLLTIMSRDSLIHLLIIWGALLKLTKGMYTCLILTLKLLKLWLPHLDLLLYIPPMKVIEKPLYNSSAMSVTPPLHLPMPLPVIYALLVPTSLAFTWLQCPKVFGIVSLVLSKFAPTSIEISLLILI